jgi:3-hydroxybutyryl-CoA dehydratase
MPLAVFEEIQTGQEFTATQFFDEAALDSFCALSGDTSPLHTNTNAAQSLGFPDRVVYGFHALGLLSRIVGTCFYNAVCVSVEADFTQPAFCGQQLRVVAQVAKIQPALRSVTLKARMLHGRQEVLRAKLIIRFLSEPS